MIIQTSATVASATVHEALEAYSSDQALAMTEAVSSRDPCQVPTQTDRLTVDNNDPSWTVEILFVQLKSTSPAPPGYSIDTGVFVAAQNQPPRTVTGLHPCRVGGRNQPIMATWAEYSGKQVLIWNGKKYENTFNKQGQAPAGKFYREVRIQFKTAVETLRDGVPIPPEVQLVLVESAN